MPLELETLLNFLVSNLLDLQTFRNDYLQFLHQFWQALSDSCTNNKDEPLCDKSKFNSFKNWNIKAPYVVYNVDDAFVKCEQELTHIFQFCLKWYVYCSKHLEIWWQVNSTTDSCINRCKKIRFNKWFDD